MEKHYINILLIEDNPGDARLVSEMLKECSTVHFEMAYAGRLNEALKALKEKKFDVVLLDLNLPDSQGLGGVERITAQEPEVPVIIFTSLDDEKLGIQAVRQHAGDYLVKGQINSNILVRSIRYAIERKRAEEALKKAQAELEIRVQQRTAELKKVVAALRKEMTERSQAEEALGAERQRFNDVLEMLPVYVVLLTPDYHVSFANRFFRERFGESHGRRCFEYLFGRSEPCEICGTYTVLKTMAPHHWEWTGPDGRNYDIFDYPFTDTDGSPLILEMGIDITEHKQAEEKLKATNALLSLFSQKPSRKQYLGAVVDLIHSWSGYRCVGIRILDDKGYIPYESYIGFSREFWESENRLSIEHAQCVCMRVITGNPDPQDASMMTPGGSFHCEDTGAFVARLSTKEQARFRGVCIQNGFLSLSIVPIRYGEKILGSIQVADNEKKKLPLPLIEFLESTSPLIGEAVNRFNLEDGIRESESHLRLLSSQLLTVQEDERKRISAELHDDIAAKLAGIKFVLEKRLMETDEKNKEMSQSLRDIVSLVLDTIASTRRIMINLRPAMIDDLGILATLNWYCREFEQIFTTIHVEKQVNIEEIEIPDYLKIVIFRIVQEGMNNIAKHSGANHISLALQKINNTLALSIEDNGRGFDVENKTLESETFQGFGMVNMRERARLSGGDFSIESFKTKGTSIKATWPLKPIVMDYHLRIEPS
jgi:signal transduction histidine kinase/DNA-binding response OmpR family regulator